MAIPSRFLDDLRSRLTLSEVIGKRVSLKRAGREFTACCPFHKEKSPSFTVNDDKQFYHCFGCGAHGDVVGFVMQHDNLSFIDAVKSLAALAGLEVPEQSPEEIKKAEKQKDLYSLMEEAGAFMCRILHQEREGEAARRYLLDRGISEESLHNFKIGYALSDGQLLRKYLAQRGYSDAQMIEAGLLRAGNTGRQPYGFFRERVMFPVLDRRGRCVAFGGRILPDHLRSQTRGEFKAPKYINSSDTPLFDKGTMLYGEPQARQAAAEGHSILVVEGYMDVIACHQAGFRGAVAPMGTALTEEQILLLWKMIPAEEKTPTLCFDGDEAGRRAAERACARALPLLRPNHSLRFAFLPNGQDPDSMIRKDGAKAFRAVLEGAMGLFDFIWSSHIAGRRFETPESRAGVIKLLKNEISKISDRDVQVHYHSLLQARISETFFPRRAPRTQGQSRTELPHSSQKTLYRLRTPSYGARSVGVRVLLAAIVNHPHIFESVEEALAALSFEEPGLQRFYEAMVSALHEEPDLDSVALCAHLCRKGFEKEMSDILAESVYVHGAFSAPGAESEHLVRKWRSFWQALQRQDQRQEIRQGWKKAYRSADEEQEKRLRGIITQESANAEDVF